jgi:hypothetical protein
MPAALVPRVAMPQTLVIGLNGRTMSVPAARSAPSASHAPIGFTCRVRSGPQVASISQPWFHNTQSTPSSRITAGTGGGSEALHS